MSDVGYASAAIIRIKKESPNEGTETIPFLTFFCKLSFSIKKESPNEGTETNLIVLFPSVRSHKKRIPE